jgi:hypothetical protein
VGGSGQSSSLRDRGFWANSDPDPGANAFVFVICILFATRIRGLDPATFEGRSGRDAFVSEGFGLCAWVGL